jgi:hypothetical protein
LDWLWSALVSPTFSGTTMDALVNAAARFSAAIEEQLKAVQDDPEPAEFALKTIAYAKQRSPFTQLYGRRSQS